MTNVIQSRIEAGNIGGATQAIGKEIRKKDLSLWKEEKREEYVLEATDHNNISFDEWLTETQEVKHDCLECNDLNGQDIDCPTCQGEGFICVNQEIRPYLPDEKKIQVQIESYLLCQKENPSIDEIKLAKYKQLSIWHKSIFETGKVPTSLGITIDARRYAHKNDLQNIQGLISRYKRGHTLPKFRDAKNKDHTLTVEQLEIFVIEIEDYHAEMFNKKHAWALEIGREDITIEELINIEIK